MTDTQREAHESVKQNKKKIQKEILDLLGKRAMSADEIAGCLNRSLLYIRPRVSELYAQSKICDTTKRVSNSSGKRAIVWGLNG